MDKIKWAYHPKTGKTIVCGAFHGSHLTAKHFDEYVRTIYFQDRDILYFRFYKPDGDYFSVNQHDDALSFDVCCAAREEFIRRKFITKKTKIQYWNTGKYLTDLEIKY